MIKNPEKFILNSQINYHKILQKGSTETTSVPNQTLVTLAENVPPGARWYVGLYYEGSGNPGVIVPGTFGVVSPDNKLQVMISRQAPTTKEIYYWRVYAD